MDKEQNKRISAIGVGGCGYNIAMDVNIAIDNNDIYFSWIDREKHEGGFPECEDLTAMVKNSEVVIFTAGLGRYASDVILQIVTTAHEANPTAKIITVCTMPYHFEGEQNIAKALAKAEKIKSICETVVVDNDTISGKMAESSLTMMNAPIVETIQEIIRNA